NTKDVIRFFFSSRRRHTRFSRDWSSDVCSSDLDWVRFSSTEPGPAQLELAVPGQHNRLNARGAIAALIAAGFDPAAAAGALVDRSEERRVGKVRRSRGSC